MTPLPIARLACAAGSASDRRRPAPTRARPSAGAACSFALALVLAGCGSAPVDEATATATPSPPARTVVQADAESAAAERPAEARPVMPGTTARPAETQPQARPRDARPKAAEPRPDARNERRPADAPPIPALPSAERRETPPLPRIARESVPQVRPGDDVVALALEHGFDPVPVAVPEGTRFARLRIGMTKQDAEALLGRPDTSLHYANEGARIPFYASDDSSRWETYYRGQGRLMFSGAWLTGEVRLIRIEFDPAEDGEPNSDDPQRDRR
jgi:hypothetical protein